MSSDFPYVPPEDLNADDRLFRNRGEGDWRYTADFSWPYGADYRYPDGFLQAADGLVEQVVANRHLVEPLVVPIVFCYRQWMELRLKDLWRLTHPDAEPRKSHDLRLLWSLVRPEIEKLGEGDDLMHLERLVNELAEVDGEQGMGFRYARDLSGELTIPVTLRVDVAHLRQTMAKVVQILDGSATGIEEWRSQQREYEAELAAEADWGSY